MNCLFYFSVSENASVVRWPFFGLNMPHAWWQRPMEVQAQLHVLSQLWLQVEHFLAMNKSDPRFGEIRRKEEHWLKSMCCGKWSYQSGRIQGEHKVIICNNFCYPVIYLWHPEDTKREEKMPVPPPLKLWNNQRWVMPLLNKNKLKGFCRNTAFVDNKKKAYDAFIILWLINFCHRNINIRLILCSIYRLNSCH